MLGKIKDCLKIILVTKKYLKIFFALLFRKKVLVKFKKGLISPPFVCSDWRSLMIYVNFFWLFPTGIIDNSVATIDFHGKKVSLDFGWLTPQELGEVFGQESYKKYFNDLTGKTVIDVGAAFGDTPVWFALNGAKKVIAIEPVPSFVALCRKNVVLNHLEDVCEIVAAGVGRQSLPDLRSDKTFKTVFQGYNQLAVEFGKTAVPILSLTDLARKYDLKNAWLKVDCEGWEYDFLLAAPNKLLRLFEKIVIEYHYGFEELEPKLIEAGFSVTHTEPISIHVPERNGKYQEMRVGFILAIKNA